MKKGYPENIKEMIEIACKKQNMTMKDLCQSISVSYNTVKQHNQGRRTITEETAIKIACAAFYPEKCGLLLLRFEKASNEQARLLWKELFIEQCRIMDSMKSNVR